MTFYVPLERWRKIEITIYSDLQFSIKQINRTVQNHSISTGKESIAFFSHFSTQIEGDRVSCCVPSVWMAVNWVRKHESTNNVGQSRVELKMTLFTEVLFVSAIHTRTTSIHVAWDEGAIAHLHHSSKFISFYLKMKFASRHFLNEFESSEAQLQLPLADSTS